MGFIVSRLYETLKAVPMGEATRPLTVDIIRNEYRNANGTWKPIALRFKGPGKHVGVFWPSGHAFMTVPSTKFKRGSESYSQPLAGQYC